MILATQMVLKSRNLETRKITVIIILKFEECGFTIELYRVMHPIDAGGMVSSVDPDQTVGSGSALFAPELSIW